MKPVLIDTDILSMFFRGQPQVETHFAAYTAIYPQVNLSIITYYEILSGLKHRDAYGQMNIFLEFVTQNTIVPLAPRHLIREKCLTPQKPSTWATAVLAKLDEIEADRSLERFADRPGSKICR